MLRPNDPSRWASVSLSLPERSVRVVRWIALLGPADNLAEVVDVVSHGVTRANQRVGSRQWRQAENQASRTPVITEVYSSAIANTVCADHFTAIVAVRGSRSARGFRHADDRPSVRIPNR